MPSTAAIAPADCKELATWQVVALSAVQASLTGTTTETTLASFSLPGGTLGPNGRLRITTMWSFVNTAQTKTMRVKFGGTTFFQFAASTQQSLQAMTIIRNRNAANSQVGMAISVAGIGLGNNPIVTSAIDTTAAQTILFTGQLASAANNLALEAYLIEALYGA